MRNRIRFALGEQTASQASTAAAPRMGQIKSLFDGCESELDQKEWVVANTGGKILCARLADIAWVRAVESGVELRIGPQSYFVRESFDRWQAKLPTDRFTRRGNALLLNLKRVQRLEAALSAVFQKQSAERETPSVSGAGRKPGRL